MNDLRAMAYGNSKVTGSVEKDNEKVQPFVPKTFIKSEEQKAPVQNIKSFNPPKIEKTKPAEKNVKPFVPASFIKKADNPQPAVKNQPESFVQKKNRQEKPSSPLEQATEYLKKGGLLKVPTEKSQPDGKDSVYRRVAKFLLLIGEDEAAKILPHLNEKQIEKIIPEIASIRTVNKDEANVILAEFNELLSRTKTSGGIETAREMLSKAYGSEKAEQMLQNAVQFEDEKPFEYLQEYEVERLYALIKDENVGVQSMVLSYIQPEKAAKLINSMKPEEKTAVALRLAKMEPVSPEVVRRVSQAMHEKAQNQVTEKVENIDGRNALAQILKKLDLNTESEILATLSDEDPDLGQDLKNRLFTYEDVENADDRFVQNELRNLNESEIAYLLGGKSEAFREKILSNISAGRRSEVRAQEEILRPMRKTDVDEITKHFVSKLRIAFESGDLIIKDRNEDKFV